MAGFRRGYRDYAFAYNVGGMPPCPQLLKPQFTPVLEWTLPPTPMVPSARVSASMPRSTVSIAQAVAREGERILHSCQMQPGLPLCDWNFEPEGEYQQYSRDSKMFSFLRPEGLQTVLHYADLA